MTLQELVKYTGDRWNSTKQLADNLFMQLQTVEGTTVTYPKDGIDAFFKAISEGIKENFDFIDVIGHELVHQEKSLSVKNVEIINDAVQKAEAVSNIPLEFITAIGKTNEFIKYLADHGVITE